MGFRHRGATQRRCQQPCFADSRQRAERRPADRGRIGSDSGFAVGCAAGRSSRGLHWRRARCGPVVRFFPRAVLLEVGEDGADGGGFLDAGDDPHGATAVDAGGDVDGKDPLEPLRPAHRTALLLGAARRVVGADVHWRRIARRPLAAPRGRQLRTQVCIRGEYAVEAGEMRARWRDQRRQLGDEIHRIPFHMRGAIAPRGLELVTHPALERYRQPLLADRRARDVAAQLFHISNYFTC